jgi:hypothetical protein
MDKSKITKQNGNIAFEEEAHIYYDVTKPEEKFISVTTLIHTFTQPFDKEFWSAYKAMEKLLSKEDWAIEKKSLLSTKKFDKVFENLVEKSPICGTVNLTTDVTIGGIGISEGMGGIRAEVNGIKFHAELKLVLNQEG